MKTVVVDLETTDLKSDIGNLIVACYGLLDDNDNIVRVDTETIHTIGGGNYAQRERRLALWAKEQWSNADIIIGQNSLAFDRHFLDGVLMRNNLDLLPKRILIDTMQTAKGKFAMGVSMANMLDVWHLGKKDSPDKTDWRLSSIADGDSLARIAERCERDVEDTAALWRKLKPVYMERWGR